MIQSILNALGQMIIATDTLYPFTDFPQISLLKMIIGLAILIIIVSLFTGKEDNDE